MSYIAHILNLVIQKSLKKLGVHTTLSNYKKSEECVDTSQDNNWITFEEILNILWQLVTMPWAWM